MKFTPTQFAEMIPPMVLSELDPSLSEQASTNVLIALDSIRREIKWRSRVAADNDDPSGYAFFICPLLYAANITHVDTNLITWDDRVEACKTARNLIQKHLYSLLNIDETALSFKRWMVDSMGITGVLILKIAGEDDAATIAKLEQQAARNNMPSLEEAHSVLGLFGDDVWRVGSYIRELWLEQVQLAN